MPLAEHQVDDLRVALPEKSCRENPQPIFAVFVISGLRVG